MNGAIVAFGVVFLVVAIMTSVLAWGGLVLASPALRRRGPAAERRAVELAALLPGLLAAGVVAVLVVHSLVAADHCIHHDHHAHLCVAHAGAWLDRPWALALSAASSVVVLGRLAVLVVRSLDGRRRVRALAGSARAIGDVRLVDSPRAFCFVAGWWRPLIYVSTAAWDGLATDERAAMLAHERGHVRGRDLVRRALIEATAIVSGPLLPSFLIGRWESANERLRDREAAHAIDADAVARALVHMVRLGGVRVAGASFEPPASQLARRIDAVYDGGPTGERAASRLTLILASSAAVLAVTAAALADPLHHALETLVG